MISIDWFTHIRYVSTTFRMKIFLAVILTSVLAVEPSSFKESSKRREDEAV